MPDGEGDTTVTERARIGRTPRRGLPGSRGHARHRGAGGSARAHLAGRVRRPAAGGATGARREDGHRSRMRRGLARRERVVAGVAGLRGWWAPQLHLGRQHDGRRAGWRRRPRSSLERRSASSPSSIGHRATSSAPRQASSWSRSCRPTRRFRATRSGSAGRPDPRDRGTRCG